MRRSSKAYVPSSATRRLPMAERLGDEVRKLLRPSAKQFGFAVTDMLLAWSEIVGEDLARRALPEKLSRTAEGAVLTIRARGPAALEIQHDAPRIIERLNTFLGAGAIARLRVHQSDLPLADPPVDKVPKVLDPAKQRELAQRLEDVENEALKAALMRLGRAVLGKPAKNRFPS